MRMMRFCLIIGAMKGGTTSLFEYLALHPEVAPSDPKEPDFFTDEERWRGGIAAYRSFWDWDPEAHTVALEASTSYTKHPWHSGVPERVKSLGDLEFRFVYVVRDPVDRLISHLSHLATRRGGPDRVGPEDFERALGVSRYATQLDVWTEHWPRELMLPTPYESLVADPAAALEGVRRFLGLRPFHREIGDLEIYNARIDMAADQTLSRVVDRAPWLAPLRTWIPRPVHRAVRRVAGGWASHTVGLTAAQRAQAVETLRPEAERLREEWGVDTSVWNTLS